MGNGRGKAGQDVGKAQTKARSCSQRAGLQGPVGRTHRHQPGRGGGGCCVQRCNPGVPHRRGLKLAGNASGDFKVKWTTPRHWQLAVGGDEEWDSPQGYTCWWWVIPHTRNLWLGRKDSTRLSNGRPDSSPPWDSKHSTSRPVWGTPGDCISVENTILPFVILFEQVGSLISFTTSQISALKS